MKNILILTFLFGISSSLFAQTREENATVTTNTLKQIENAKSGNLQDAFGSFYQFAFKNMNIDEKSLDINSTLFSLVKNYDEDILTTKSRNGIEFLRNFQINIKVNLDEKLNFNGYSGGFTYAILNKRDKGFIDIENTTFAPHINELNLIIANSVGDIAAKEMQDFQTANGRNMNQEEAQKLSYDITKVATAIRNGKTVETGLQNIYTDYKAILDTKIKNSIYFQAIRDKSGNPFTTSTDVYNFLQESKNDFLKELEKKPFLSIASSGITDKDGKLNKGALELVFLLGGSYGELDIRGKYNYADTLDIPDSQRSLLNGKVGYNLKVIKGKEEKSYFEIKAYAEYNKILKNVLPEEDEENFSANADFRFRLTDNLWIPLTVKYDLENSNFLGFLNVTYNFGQN
ncbi:hypothetical protein [Flavobacterium sp.]|uniref:hypothetical protein n=1 Tax=Flavobacterium sp. TaxID=239 RepID=UPI00391BEBA4